MKLRISLYKNCSTDYYGEYFTYKLDNIPSIIVNIIKKGEATYPDFIGDITFDISCEIKNNKLDLSLTNPNVEM